MKSARVSALVSSAASLSGFGVGVAVLRPLLDLRCLGLELGLGASWASIGVARQSRRME